MADVKYRKVPIIGIEGLDEIEVPDSFTDDMIKDALKKHPNYKEEKSTLRQSAENVAGFVNEMGKGIPIVGHHIPRTKYAEHLNKNWPKTAMGARIAGGTASMIPLMMASGGIAGPGLAANIAMQGATGGTVGVLDKLSEKGMDATGKELGTSGVIGALGGAAGPVVGRFITPSTQRGISNTDIQGAIERGSRSAHIGGAAPMDPSKAASQAIKEIPKNPKTMPWIADTLLNTATTTGVGALGGKYLLDDPQLGALVGMGMGMGSPALRDALLRSPWMTNKLMHNPSNQAILDAMMTAPGISGFPRQ